MILTQNDGWLASKVADEVLMLNIERGEYVGLNASGAAIWEILETPRTVDQLIDVLMGQFDVGREEANRDIDSFVEAALERGILAEQ